MSRTIIDVGLVIAALLVAALAHADDCRDAVKAASRAADAGRTADATQKLAEADKKCGALFAKKRDELRSRIAAIPKLPPLVVEPEVEKAPDPSAVIRARPRPEGPEVVSEVSADVLGITWLDVPDGCFDLGSTSTSADSDERGGGRQCVPAFSLMETEVTWSMYRRCVADMGACSEPRCGQLGDTYPVVCVSDIQAEAFAEWVSRKTAWAVSLPTEIQWEYVASGLGSEVDYAWCVDAKHCPTATIKRAVMYPADAPKPVCSKARARGFCDLNGNVWEWTSSMYGGDYAGKKEHARWDSIHEWRVARGGFFYNDAARLRSSKRLPVLSSDADDSIGFRLQRSPVR